MSFQRYRYRTHTVCYDTNPKIKVLDDTIPERIQKVLKCERYSILNDDQRALLLSFLEYWNRRFYLTSLQYEAFFKIEKKLSPEYIQKEDDFLSLWEKDQTFKENFKLCCEYYLENNYYGSIVYKYVGNKNYIPTFDEYEKVCENKYALRLIDAFRAPSKFKIGDFVKLAYRGYLHPSSDYCIVLVPGLTPTRPVKGGKKYKVQDIKTGQQFIVEEKYMAKLKIKKEKASSNA